MLGVLRRAAERRRERVLLLRRLMLVTPPEIVATWEFRWPDLRGVFDAGGPALAPYEGLAELWHEYTAHMLMDYPAYIDHLARRHGTPLRSVLDLACGTGLLSARLAGVAADVVGVDASDAMLTVARQESARPGVSYVRGDMRDFDLGRAFDAAVCASNSLNYVADRAELRAVFARVARHLRPGGLFAFDVVTDYGMRQCSQGWLNVTLGRGQRFVQGSGYEAAARRETAWVVLPTGLETHMRSPIDKSDVQSVAAETGLTVVDQFSHAGLFGGWDEGAMMFHVLRRPE